MYKVRLTKLTLHTYFSLNNNFIICNELFKLGLSARIYRKSLVTNFKSCYQHCFVKQQPNYIYKGVLRTMGHLKRRKSLRSGNSIRELGFRRFSSVAHSDKRLSIRLNELKKINRINKEHTNYKLKYIISNVKVLILCYDNNKNIFKNYVLRAESTFLTSINLKLLTAISQELKIGMFEFKLNRLINIFKCNKKVKNFLTKHSISNSIIEQAFFTILNTIYTFSSINSSDDLFFAKAVRTAFLKTRYKFQEAK